MKLKSMLTAVGAGVLGASFAFPAQAGLILNTTITATGTGLGAMPTLVTIQETGPVSGTESGCISFGSSTTCVSGTGLVGGDTTAITQLRTAADLPGITNAGQLALVVNLNEPGVDQTATLTGLYLSIYSPTGTLLGLHQYTGPDLPLVESPGIGSAGTVFTLDAAEQAAAIMQCPNVAQCVFGGGLEFLAGTAQGGPETMFLSFVSQDGVIPPGQQPVSEPASLALFGLSLLTLAAMRRKRA